MLKTLIHYIGDFLVILGACLGLPFLIALVYGETTETRAFLVTIIICLVSGLFVNLIYKKELEQEALNRRESYLIVSSAWIIASLIGCLPYLLSGVIDNFFLAFFEACSGFSTTGASVFTDIEHLPHSILIWRCFSQWLGGMGIIVLFVALLPRLGAKAASISSVETPGPISVKISAKSSDSAKNLYKAYIILTFILFLLLWAGKMNCFDALAHAFSTMATGGLSTHNTGLAFYHSNYIYLIIGIFAFMAGTNFVLFFEVLAGKAQRIIKDEEFRAYLLIISICSILIAVSLYLSETFRSFTEALLRALFQVINTLSTTGFMTGDSNWPSFCVLLMVFLMIVGGCSSSTAGGIKISRMLVAGKIVSSELKRRTHDNLIDDIKFNNQYIPGSTLSYIYAYSTLFFATIIIGTLIVSIFGGGTAETNFLTVISCISSLGPGLDTLGLLCEYHLSSPACIITYNLIMIAGRLEITTLLVMLSRHFWASDRVFY